MDLEESMKNNGINEWKRQKSKWVYIKYDGD